MTEALKSSEWARLGRVGPEGVEAIRSLTGDGYGVEDIRVKTGIAESDIRAVWAFWRRTDRMRTILRGSP